MEEFTRKQEEMTENDETIVEKCDEKIHANYLLHAANYLKEIPSNPLRCHWNILLADLMRIKHLALAKRENLNYTNCEYCLTPWRNGLYSAKVMPRPKRGRKLRRILRRVEEQKELSKFQKSLADVMHEGQIVVLNCKVCHKSSKYKIPVCKVVITDAQDPEGIDQIEEDTKKKRKKRKKKNNKKNGLKLTLTCPEQVHEPKKSEKDAMEVNVIDNNDVVIIEDLEVSKINDTESLKRKSSSNDDLIDVVSLELRKPKKIRKKDRILANPLPIKPLGAQTKQSKQNARRDDFIPFDNFNSKPRPKTISKFTNQNERKQNKKNFDFNKEQRGKNKNLNRWKRLIAEEEVHQTKTSSLEDFLSTL